MTVSSISQSITINQAIWPKSLSDMTDDELLEYLSTLDSSKKPDVVGFILARDKDKLLKFIYKRGVTDKEDAQDIMCNVWMVAVEQIDNFKYQGIPVYGWLTKIAGIKIKEYFRKKQDERDYIEEQKKRLHTTDHKVIYDKAVEACLQEILKPEDQSTKHHTNSFTENIKRDAKVLLARYTKLKLKDIDAQIIYLFHINNFDCAEIGRYLGLSHANVRQRLVRARKSLRLHIEQSKE